MTAARISIRTKNAKVYPRETPAAVKSTLISKCQGISAGNTGGGEVNINLPKDFYKTMSAKNVAGMCWGNCYNDILERGILNSLMKKAAKKNGFLQDYSKKV